MPTIEEMLNIELNDLRERIIANSEAVGQRATGKTYDSMKVMATSEGGQLTGRKYFATLETGRKPGRRPPIAAIKEWTEAKGIYASPYAIANKIAKEGTNMYIAGGTDAIFTQEIEKKVDDIKKNLRDIYVEKIKGGFRNENR